MKNVFLNGCRFAYDLLGAGPVSVILETGLGAEAKEWRVVADEITRGAAVFLYDRLGRGGSDAPSRPRTSVDMHFELSALLEVTGTKPPFVLVGHSFGGVLMRLFADRRKRDVHGLVLIESMHPKQFEELGPSFPVPSGQEVAELTHMRQFWQQGWTEAESTPELADLPESLRMDSKVVDLGEIPLHILTAESFSKLPFVPDQTATKRLQTIWSRLQQELPALSSETRRTHLSQSGHFVQRDAPGSIVEAIKFMLL